MFIDPSPGQSIGTQASDIPQDAASSSKKAQKEKTNSLDSQIRFSKSETFRFRPLEAELFQGSDYQSSLGTDLYCKVKLGRHSKKTSTVEGDSGNPEWFEMISLPRKHNESFARITIRDRDRANLFEKFGKAKIPLAEVAAHGRLTKWYPLVKKEVIVGKILMQIHYIPAHSSK